MVRVFESISSSSSRGVALRVELGWLGVLAANGRLAVEKLGGATPHEPRPVAMDQSGNESTLLPRVSSERVSDAPFRTTPIGLLHGRLPPTVAKDVDPDDVNSW